MITLVLIVCLSGSPDVCREEQPPIVNLSLMGCAVQGQLIAQEWLGEHPKWSLKGWKCKVAVTQERGA